MTSLMKHPGEEIAPWSMMPGWGVVADLTPPELIEMRRLRWLRKVIGLALAAVLVLCVIGYVVASLREKTASDNADSSSDNTAQLTAERARYANVTKLESLTSQINSQVSGLVATEIDVAALSRRIVADMPGGVTLSNATITVNADAAAAPATTPDAAGAQSIGQVTLAGTSKTLSAVADFVQKLDASPGLIDVVPNTNSAASNGNGSWTISLQLTDELYVNAHGRPEASTTGGSR